MPSLTLAPLGPLARHDEDEFELRPTSVVDLLPYLPFTVEVDAAFTLGDLFRLVDHDDSALLAVILGEDIGSLLEEARAGAVPDEDKSVEFLQVCNRHEDGRLHRDFEGWGKWDEPCDEARTGDPDRPREGGFAIEFAPLGELYKLPIRYNPELIFRGPAYQVELPHGDRHHFHRVPQGCVLRAQLLRQPSAT